MQEQLAGWIRPRARCPAGCRLRGFPLVKRDVADFYPTGRPGRWALGRGRGIAYSTSSGIMAADAIGTEPSGALSGPVETVHPGPGGVYTTTCRIGRPARPVPCRRLNASRLPKKSPATVCPDFVSTATTRGRRHGESLGGGGTGGGGYAVFLFLALEILTFRPRRREA
jgi:hypothetical protein